MSEQRHELAIFAYPWDLRIDGAEQSVRQVRELGCGRMSVAVAYHSAEVLAPRRDRAVQVTAEPDVAHFPLGGGFSDLALPSGRLAAEYPGLAAELGRAARSEGLGLTAWVVVCHNSALASGRPDVALENCFGDRSAHGLCPSHQLVRAYALELCAQVIELGIFDELFVESLAYLPVGHGHPHELWAVRDDPASRYLRSLCFCPACLQRGAEFGIDGERLRAWVAATLQRTWNSSLGIARDPDPGDELSGHLVSRPDLHAWTVMRCTRTAELAGEIAALAHSRGLRLAAGLGVFARPAALNWMEGIDPARLAGSADRVAAMCYSAGAGSVARDLDYYLATVEPRQVQLIQTLWPAHHAGLDVLLGKIRLARDAGVRAFGLYNLTTAPAPVLRWVPAVAEALAG